MYSSAYPRKKLRFLAATAGATIALCCSSVALAQASSADAADRSDTGVGPTLDEIVITARKREEKLDDVPISVSVVSGSRLEAQGIVSLDQASQAMPGVSVTPTPVGDLLYIRGVGSGQNQGFEMSVATFVDGVHFGRGRSARHAFLDVDRIEVLKGPQPILFGKNTTAGAFNITTRKPTNSFEAYLEGYVEPEFNTFQATGVVSGPISDTLKGRLVVRSSTSDGYLKNGFLKTDEPSRKDWVARGVLVWNPNENFELTFKGEYGENDLKGGPSQISKASPLLQGLVRGVDPTADFVLDYRKSGPGTVAPFDREYDKGKTYNTTVTANWSLGEYALTSVSSYVGYDLDYSFDSDFTPLNLVQQVWDQRWTMWSQELRLNSPTGRRFEYTTGLYYSAEDLKNDKLFAFNFSQTPLAALGGADRLQQFSQETRDWSVFAEGTWHATEELSVVGGVRYTSDKKTVDKRLYWAKSGTTTPDATITRFGPLGLGAAHQYNGLERETTNASVALTVQYDPGPVMYYASYKQGFKSGGFDEGNASGKLSEIEFDDEKAVSYEIGLKGRMIDGRLLARAAAFHNKYDNLQVSMFDGVAALIVGNAAQSTSSGVEVEAQLAATDRLTLAASATYLDAHYRSYKAGPCAYGKGAVCDLSGQPLPFAPEWSGTFNARWEDDFAGGWKYALDANAFYSGSFDTAGDLDPFVTQSAFGKIDASVTLTSPSGAWRLALVGKNLTDKVTAHFGNDIPLSNLLGNNYQQFVDPPRTIAFQVHYQFQ